MTRLAKPSARPGYAVMCAAMLAACASTSPIKAGDSPTTSTSSPAPIPCALQDITSIEAKVKADPQLSVAPSQVPVDDHSLIRSTDGRSFIATVDVADLTAAGIHTIGHLPSTTPIILFVNHGTFDETLPISGGGNLAPSGTTSQSPTAPIHPNWILFGINPANDTEVFSLYAPDYPCFRA